MKRCLLGIVAVLVLAPHAGTAEKIKPDGELRLDRAIRIALQQNPEILKALHEIERTRGLVIEVRAEALPHVVGTANYRQEKPSLLERSSGSGSGSFSFETANGQSIDLSNAGGGFSGSGALGDKSWRVSIEARQLLYSGGQVQAAMKIAKFTDDQSYWLLRETVDRIIAQVRTQFYSVLLDRKLITVAEQNLQLLGDELKDQTNRFEAGTVPKFNVLRAEVAVANSKPELIRARNNYLIAELELAKTLGLDAAKTPTGRPGFTVAGQLRARARDFNLPKALAVARQRRALLMAQKQGILTEEQQITVAKAGTKPRLEASAGWEFRNSRLTDNLSREVNGWFYGVDGTWNIFDGFETKGKVIQAEARLASARTIYHDSVQQVELEVQKAHAHVREAQELIASQGKVIEQADEALRLARERLAAGAGTQLDVLDAQFALTRARVTEQQALYDYNAAAAEFDRAMGADTVYDDTFEDPAAVRARAKLRPGQPELRAED